MRICERVNRPWIAAMCRGLFPSLLCGKKPTQGRGGLSHYDPKVGNNLQILVANA